VVAARSRHSVGPVQPSSLIFVVIVAIWAAYLIQHWVRRREHVATARSVDRFSEAMRVLERRSPLPRSELSAPRPHSYAVRPASARPAVTVKRAVAVEAAPHGSLMTAMVEGGRRARSALTARSASRPTEAPAEAPGGSRPAAGRLGRPDRPDRRGRSASAVLVRRVRGVSFLVTLGSLPVTVVLSALHMLLWVSVAVSAVAFAAIVVWLRTSVLRERATRRASARSYPATAARSARTASTPSRREAAQQAPAATASTAGERPAAVVFDVEAPVAGDVLAVAVDQSLLLEVAMPGGWSPVPVPPPTYTLKDPASRPRPEPAGVSQRPVPIEVEDDDVERMAAEHHLRVAGG